MPSALSIHDSELAGRKVRESLGPDSARRYGSVHAFRCDSERTELVWRVDAGLRWDGTVSHLRVRNGGQPHESAAPVGWEVGVE